jgi:hypothetical protein
MRAKKGEWFSLKWEPRDYYNIDAYNQLKKCPKFICASKDTPSITLDLEGCYPDLRITSAAISTIFVEQESGLKVPTHYKPGEFMPGDNPKYDEWLSDYYKINSALTDQIKAKNAINQKTIYLEHTSKIIRHDMHSGINTYIPRGLKVLLEKLDEKIIKEYKLRLPLRLLEEGLKHTQQVYKGVYAFTNLVKINPQIEKDYYNLKEILEEFLEKSAYRKYIEIEDLPSVKVNPALFCIAIDNFLKNSIAYNTSKDKKVRVYMRYANELCIEDNGSGMSQYDYDVHSLPYIKADIEKDEDITIGMGINISNAILKQHEFAVSVEKLSTGTRIGVKLRLIE